MSPHLSNDKRFHIQIIRFRIATASINKVKAKMGNNNLGPVADGIEHPANLAPGYDTDHRYLYPHNDPKIGKNCYYKIK